jgi:ribosome-binding protein aMBF1 (putative translation factor)
MSSTIGQRVRYARLRRGLSIAEAARKARLSPDDWLAIELHDARPALRTCVRLERILNASPDWLEFGNADIAGRIQQARERAGLTIDEAADRIAVSPHDWRAWESGLDLPNAKQGLATVRLLGISFEWLIEGDAA